MNHKYLILLLFIFLVFLMGSVNSTVTNVFYNNTTGTQDHALLTNLSYNDSGHTGFQSSASLNNSISQFTNDAVYVKTTDTNLNITSRLHVGVNDGDTSYSVVIKDGRNLLENLGTTNNFWESNETMRSAFFLTNSYHLAPANYRVGFYFYGSNYQNGSTETNRVLSNNFRIHGDQRYNITSQTNETNVMNLFYTGFKTIFIGASVPNSTIANVTDKLYVDGNATITGLAGSGNAYSCLDSTGKLYRGTPGC